MLVRALEEPADFGAERAAAVEALLSCRFGRTARLTNACLRDNVSSWRAAQRSFWRLTAVIGDQTLDIHAKLSSESRRPSIDEHLSGRSLPVPEFLGWTKTGTDRIILWEYCEGMAEKSFSAYGVRDIERIVRAVAAISATPDNVVDGIGLSKGMKWLQPVSSRIKEVLKAEQLASVRDELNLFHSVEAAAIDELREIDCRTLTHNDVKAPNVLVGTSITLVDWDSATLGPHGASLRRFTCHGPEVESLAARTYVQAMSEYGISVDQAQVLRVMRFQEIFWALVSGVRRNSRKRVLVGLRLVPEFLSRPKAY